MDLTMLPFINQSQTNNSG